MAGDILNGLLDDTMLGILIVVLVIMLSTGYVYLQQMQPERQQFPPGNHQNNNPAFLARQAAAGNAASHGKHDVISTANLTPPQLRLHRSLPLRNGARTITICVDALLHDKEDSDKLGWQGGDENSNTTLNVLSDLLHIADVYLLCVVRSEKDTQVRQRIRDFLVSHPALKYDPKTNWGIKPHKILFCTTVIGKIAFVRQLEPQIHVEVDKNAVRDLEKHVPRVVHVVTSAQDRTSTEPNHGHHVADGFAAYFKLLGA